MSEEQLNESAELDAVEESQEGEQETVEDNPSAQTEEPQTEESGAAEAESQSDESDESLTDDSSGSIDYAAKIQELEEKAATEHKRAAGWDNKYREVLAEKKAADTRMAELEARLTQQQEVEASPVWDKRNPKNSAFMAAVPQLETAIDLIQSAPEEQRAALAEKVRERFGDETLTAYQGFQNHQKETAKRIAAGDVSLFEEAVSRAVEERFAERESAMSLKQEINAMFDDKENLQIYTEHQDEVESYIQSGLSVTKAVETVRGKVSIESLKKQLAEAESRASQASAQKEALSKKAAPPENHSSQAATIDHDAIWKRAEEIQKEKFPHQPNKIESISQDLLEAAINNL